MSSSAQYCSLLKDAVVRAHHQTATIGSDLSSDPPAAQQAPLTFPLWVSHLGDPFTQRSFSGVASVTRFATPGRRPRPPMSRRFSEPLHSLRNKRKPSIQWGGPYPNNTCRCTTSQEASYVTSVLGLTGERKDANISSVVRLEVSCCQDG